MWFQAMGEGGVVIGGNMGGKWIDGGKVGGGGRLHGGKKRIWERKESS